MTENKSVKFVDFIFNCIKASIIFWKFLIIKWIIFGLIEAIRETIKFWQIESNDSYEYVEDKKIENILSLIVFVFASLIFFAVSYIRMNHSSLVGFISVILIIYGLMMTIINFHYVIANQEMGIKNLYQAIKNVIVKLDITLLIIGIISIEAILLYLNLVLGIFIGPGLLIKCLLLYLKKKSEGD